MVHNVYYDDDGIQLFSYGTGTYDWPALARRNIYAHAQFRHVFGGAACKPVEITEMACEPQGVDYLSQLPCELLEKIFYGLPPNDALSLLQANRRLHEVVGSCDAYWKTACIDGVMIASEATLHYHLKSVGSPKELYVQMSRQFDRTFHRSLKSATLPRRYPAKESKGCRSIQNGLIVEILTAGPPKKDSPKQELKVIVAKLDKETGTFNRLYSCDFSDCHDIKTAFLAANSKHLLFSSECGHWVCCDYSSKTEVYRWEGMGPSESLCLGCCKTCFLVVSPDFGLNVHYGRKQFYWHFTILKLGKRKGVQQVVEVKFPAEHIHEVFLPLTLMTQEVYVVPDSDDLDDNGFCQSHRIILQCGTAIVIYRFEYPATLITKPEKILCTICDDPESSMDEPFPFSLEFPAHLIVLSADSQQLGVIYDYCLHVWDLRTFEKHCIDLDLWSPTCELLVLGRVFSILSSGEGRGHLQVGLMYL